MVNLYQLLAFLAILIVGLPAWAVSQTVSPTISPSVVRPKGVIPSEFVKATRQIEDYFNSLTTLQARFTQSQSGSPNQSSRGVFSVNRPRGQFLWQYTSPIRQKVVGTGTAVYYVDQSAKIGDGQVTQLPVDAGLSRLLRGEQLSLSKVGLKVTGVKSTPQTRTITLAATDGRRDQQGLKQIILTFNEAGAAPILSSFSATDMLNVTTEIQLTEVKLGLALSPRLFAYTPALNKTR